jgi:hypothetical protein
LRCRGIETSKHCGIAALWRMARGAASRGPRFLKYFVSGGFAWICFASLAPTGGCCFAAL